MIPDARVHRVHRAVTFIEPRLFTPLSSEDGAHAVGGSLFELHRHFTDVYGVSLGAYIRARRLSEAARMLREGPLDVLSIALRCRYGSQASFTRAFRRQFGVPPGAWRRGTGTPHAMVRAATVQELVHRDGLQREPELHWLHQDRVLMGVEARVEFTCLADFVRAQEALVQQVGEHHEAVGLARQTHGETIDLFLGVDATPSGAPSLASGRLLQGLYAVFKHQGPAHSVRHSVAFFAHAWRPEPGLVLGLRPDAEVFSLADRHSDTLALELWLSVDGPSTVPTP